MKAKKINRPLIFGGKKIRLKLSPTFCHAKIFGVREQRRGNMHDHHYLVFLAQKCVLIHVLTSLSYLIWRVH